VQRRSRAVENGDAIPPTPVGGVGRKLRAIVMSSEIDAVDFRTLSIIRSETMLGSVVLSSDEVEHDILRALVSRLRLVFITAALPLGFASKAIPTLCSHEESAQPGHRRVRAAARRVPLIAVPQPMLDRRWRDNDSMTKGDSFGAAEFEKASDG
jgi:hypothetical protein